MPEFLDKFNSGELIALVFIVGGLLAWVIVVAATQWRRVRIAEFQAAIKQQMLEKGMSAADIEKVMNAGPGSGGGAPVTITGNESQDRAALAQRMVDEGYEAGDIERVLKAYQPVPKQDKAGDLVARP